MRNIIEEYESGLITFEELSKEIWGYGERLIGVVGEEKFAWYIKESIAFDKDVDRQDRKYVRKVEKAPLFI